jgi:hypothetical protein
MRPHMFLQGRIGKETQLTTGPTANMPLMSLVPAGMRSQLGSPLECFPTPLFLALEEATYFCNLYTAEFSH